ncbi:YIP1 family protein [Clostridium sporogenes]|uniref:YIP1 family protein n=1 Tax=Clostridium sporogenes TaxID=1509 RepID=UPI003DA4105D
MNNFITFFKSPTMFFSKDKEDTSIIAFFLLFLAILFLRTYTSIFVVTSADVSKLLDTLKLNQWCLVIISLVANLFILLVTVNIIYLLVSISTSIFEHINFNKKNVKNLIYVSYLVPITLSYFIQLIFMLVTKQSIPAISTNIISLFVYFILSFMVFLILKITIKTKNLHKYLPIIVFLGNSISCIKYFIK